MSKPTERTLPWLLLGLLTSLCACSGGGGGGGSGILVTAALQDLGADPSGHTTVVTFSAAPPALTTANFESTGGQNATSVLVAGTDATVTWDARVTPAHQVRVVGALGVAAVFAVVATSDASAPTFTIPLATQLVDPATYGGDSLTVAFAGPNVVAATAEDVSNWTLSAGGSALDLTGSTLTFDALFQELDVVLGPAAHLPPSFTLTATGILSVADVPVAGAPVAGMASDDANAPTLLSSVQDLVADEFGRAVLFSFDEAMDPGSTPILANFGVTLPNVATSVTPLSPTSFRVTFNAPVVPGVDSVTITGLEDVHGNALSNPGVTAVTQPAPGGNAYDAGTEATTVEGALGDFITVVTTQALDPRDAVDPTRWDIVVNGGSIVMADQVLTYDLLAKTLTVDLDFDMTNGQTFTVDALNVREVDGQTFAATSAPTAISGDASLPTVLSAVQNRTVDPDGFTVDVRFSEDLEQVSAETLVSYAFSGGGHNVTAATLVGTDVVRLTVDAVVVPPDLTIDVQDVTDLAGNVMAADAGRALTSTDVAAPSALGGLARAVEGAANDSLTVNFNDSMIAAEVTDPANWTFESPAGNPIDLTPSTLQYDAVGRQASVRFDGPDGVNLKAGDDWSVSLANMRDIAGNAVTSGAVGGPINAETRLPSVEAIYVQNAPNTIVHVRFDEACDEVEDLLGLTSYEIEDGGTMTVKGSPSAATRHADQRGVMLQFPFGVVAGVDLLSVRGVTDLAGNPLFPLERQPIEAETGNDLLLVALGSSVTTVSGESNDVVVLEFNERPSTQGLLSRNAYTIAPNGGGPALDLGRATFAHDGDRTVTVTLGGSNAPSFTTGTMYDVTVTGLLTAQGRPMPGPDQVTLTAAGDAAVPTLAAGQARVDFSNPLDSLLITLNEAVDPASVAVLANTDLNGGTNPDATTVLGPRTVRAQFVGGVSVGDALTVTYDDLAGNTAAAMTVVAAADGAGGPGINAVSGTAVEGAGGDRVVIDFNKPIDPTTGLDPSSYAILNGATPISLSGARLVYESAIHRLTVLLAVGQELDPTQSVNVMATGVLDHSGQVMTPDANISGPTGGDTTPPDPLEAEAFVNRRADPSGRAVDVRFGEDVQSAFVTTPSNWASSGGQLVTAVQMFRRDHYRLTLSAALAGGETLSLPGVPDLAGNAAGVFSLTPLP